MQRLADVLIVLVLVGIPLLMLVLCALPYGWRYVIANVGLLSLVGFGLFRLALSNAGDFGASAAIALVYGGALAVWALVLHGGKAVWFLVRRVAERRQSGKSTMA